MNPPELVAGAEDHLDSKKIMVAKPHDRLVLVSSTPCDVSTPSLSTSSSTRGLQVTTLVVTGFLIWRSASRLDAFSGYLFRT